MKILLSSLFLIIASTAVAQPPPGMNEGNMQAMMQQMQKMQECMKNVDQSELAGLEEKSLTFKKETDALCAAGKRKAAQEKAMSFAKKMIEIPAVMAMQKCTKMMVGAMQKLPFADSMKELNEKHICDQ